MIIIMIILFIILYQSWVLEIELDVEFLDIFRLKTEECIVHDQYKENWNPNIKVRSQFKSVIAEDFRKARIDARTGREVNLRNNERVMSDVRASRNLDAENRTRRYFKAMNTRNNK